MIQRGGRARFAPEALNSLRVLGDVFRKKFQRDVTAEPRVLGFIDDAHASAAKFFDDGVVGNRTTDNGGSIRHSPRSLLQPLYTGNCPRPVTRHTPVFRVTPNCAQRYIPRREAELKLRQFGRRGDAQCQTQKR